MALPWINTTANPLQRAQQIVNRGKPLTTSYPNSTFFITAQNGQPLAPGQSPAMRRVNTPGGLGSVGDPRSTGSFYDITNNANLQALITGDAPQSFRGGNATTVNLGQPPASRASIPVLWIVVAAVGAVLLLK